MIVFGPVPSRRLGQSLGVNNIPPKTCSYACVYCQIGRTDRMRAERCAFYEPREIFEQVERRLRELGDARVDYLSFVPDGEPTLDVNLGKHIDLLKPLGIKIAVITNGSLLWMDDVQEALQKADWVSVKIDAADANTWKRIDRPHGSLHLDKVSRGAADFAKRFQGTLVTETMLVKGINDSAARLSETADNVRGMHPAKAYLLVPTRPPAETDVSRPAAETLQLAFEIFRQKGVLPECVAGDEDDAFFFTDDFAGDLLRITAVHPVREDIITDILKRRNLDAAMIGQLIEKGLISRFVYEGKPFLKRNV